MIGRLRRIWESRAPREQAVVTVLTIIVSAALYLWLINAVHHARQRVTTSVMALRVQSGVLDRQAIEYARLRAMPPPAASQTDLRTHVKARADASGMSRTLSRIDAPDPDQVTLVLGAVAFPDWLDWIASLKLQHIRLESCRIEALSAPGLVSVTATLARTSRR